MFGFGPVAFKKHPGKKHNKKRGRKR